MKRTLLLFFALGFIAYLAQAQSNPTIYSRWSGRVLTCSDTLNIFKAYQWYEDTTTPIPTDGSNPTAYKFVKVDGQTGQYYAKESGFNGYYYVIASLTDGTKRTSNILSVHTKPVAQVSVTPNPVSRNNSVKIETTSADTQLANIQIYSANGVKVSDYNTDSASYDIQAPLTTGCYLVRIKMADGSTITQKLFVK